MYIFIFVNVLFENTYEIWFHTYSTQYPSDALLLWRIWNAQAGMYPSDACCWGASWNVQRGYVIPDSHFRSQVVYMRWAVPVWVSSLRDRRCAWPGGLPRTELLYIVDTFTQYVLYFDLYCYYIMFLLPKFIMLIKLVKLYYVCSLSWSLFTFKY